LRLEVKAPALGETAAHLPWLAPGADALVALARAPAATAWDAVRRDPGAVLLVLRQTHATGPFSRLSKWPAVLREPAVLDGAVRLLDHPGTAFVNWNQDAVLPIYRGSVTLAEVAAQLARRTDGCDPDNAWVAGLLAPLGWLAVCAVQAEAAALCLAELQSGADPAAVQQRLWGLDQSAIARRLARRWALPRWLAGTVGQLELPVDVAYLLGADPQLFRIVQLAVGLTWPRGNGLPLPIGTDPAENAAALGMAAGALEELQRDLPAWLEPPLHSRWLAPSAEPLLRDVLVLAANNRRLAEAPAWNEVETDLDQLHAALRVQKASEANRLQALKLGALAELAAGAGHEINNPLAVISGQAQYLLKHDPEPTHQHALQTIVSQAQRIHHLLSDLMQFARPARPQKQPVDVAVAIREVADALGELATERRVQLICPPTEHTASTYADPRQVRTALTCLLRNAIEAAPAEGWAGIRLEAPDHHRLEVVVEDNGGGLSRAQQEHLFDPFYSGRPAGRGRGLGLPTAWRLAREQGGDVRFEDCQGNPTRFVLSLPRYISNNGSH
jgi:signal transduction histidine kinase